MLVLKYGIMLSSMGIAATHFELIIAALDGKVITWEDKNRNILSTISNV